MTKNQGRICHSLLPILLALSLSGAKGSPKAEIILPEPAAPFAGVIGQTYANSKPSFPKPARAPAGAPNVLLVLTDDVGFGAASTFGGPVPTPNLDRLAAHGLKYNRFHTTSVCSPTRAALLTGRNPHNVGSGSVPDLATGFPGYSNTLPRSAATLAEVLKLNGYNTAMFGKHHNVQPGAGSAAGPFDQWPTGLGFEYFFGFIRAETDQFSPVLYRNITPIDAPKDRILDAALVDDAITWVHNQQAAAPDKPFLLYLAPGTAHAPHQAPSEWIARFRGKFDQGWDRLREQTLARQKGLGVVPQATILAPRPEGVPTWDSLSDDEKRVSARMMEVFAAMLAHQDHQFGRLIDELERTGELENTLVIFIEGDNGGSAEGGISGAENWMATFANGATEKVTDLLSRIDGLGGPNTYGNYPVGWAWATNAPFPWMKKIASHLGGTRNGMVISWPSRIKERGIRSQYHHVVDIAPTILEAAGISAPTIVNGARQQRIDGISLAYSFDSPEAADRRTMQYYEMQGSRAIYNNGWIANTKPRKMPWTMSNPEGSPDDYVWELYDLDTDFSQSRDLAATYPKKLEQLRTLFEQEAQRNNVLPLDDRESHERARASQDIRMENPNGFVYWGKDISVTDDVAPPMRGVSFSIMADVIIPNGSANGVLLARGSRFGGWSFYLKNGRPAAHHAFTQQKQHQFEIISPLALVPGKASIRYDFDYDGGGIGKGGLLRISIDGKEVVRGRIDRTVTNTAGLGEMFDVGRDTGNQVLDYGGPSNFTGDIQRLEVKSN
ncbi:arylsulfatase [Sphingomonas sp. KC8]|uniref:arylsulfatase n=1 Tax=Sphingomonas sp. KC8 TaxID=1030157 RepID=UPI00055E8CA6|nr:arylsulfatase [Sphingomonas sp. KC8]ARS28268.1 arylsulfatase [Sphingomonas sp. KC8]